MKSPSSPDFTGEKEPSLFRLALPLIISFWMRSLFSFVDTLYASFLSDAAIAAIGLAIPLEFIMIATWVGLSTGLTSYLSKALGANSTKVFDQFLSTTWKIIALVIPVFVGIGVGVYFYAPYMGLEEKVAEGFAIYGSVLLVGSAFTGFWSIIPDSIVKAHHDTRSTMIAGILSNVLNLTLNTIFLFVFHMGLLGIALSTVLGRFAGLTYAIYRSRRLESDRRAELEDLPEEEDLRPHPLWDILALALPSSVAYLLMASETGIVNYLLADTPDSTASIAAYGIFYRIILFASMPLIATTVATLPFVARYAEQGKLSLIYESYHSVLRGGALYSIFLVGPACYWGAAPLMRILSDSPRLLHLGTFAIQVVPLFCLALVPYQLSRPVFEGFQRGKPTVVMAFLRYLLLSVPCALLGRDFGPYLGLTPFRGLLWGLLLATVIASLVFLVWTEIYLKIQSETEEEKIQPSNG